MLSIDHAVLAVGDLDEAGERILRTHGLASVPGGVHPRWGTANRIIPLGRDYLELIAVVDPAVADTTAFGRTLLALTADGRDHWAELCVADTDVDATAARLGLEVEAGLRTTPDGREIRWHGAGLEEDVRRPYLPFFITWDVPDDLMPGRMAADHLTPASGIERVEVAGDAAVLDAWLGGAGLPIDVVAGPEGITAVTLSLADGGSLELCP
ncbi:MAG TPA: VOC family protein [Actinomycetota bacterium]